MPTTSHAQVTCNHCNLNYIAKIVHAPICPRCGAVYVAKGKHFKNIYETTAVKGASSIHGLKTEQTPKGVVISWRDYPIWMQLWYTFFGVSYFLFMLVMPIIFIIGQVTHNDELFQMAILPMCIIGSGIALYLAFMRHKFIITDTEIIDRAPPKRTRCAIETVEDVFVRRLRESPLKKQRLVYEIYLKTSEGIHPLAIFRNEQVAAMIAHRIKVVMQVHLNQPQKRRPNPSKQKKRTPKKINWRKRVPVKPHLILRQEKESVLDLQWKIDTGSHNKLVGVPLIVMMVGIVLSVFIFVDATAESAELAIYGIFLLVGGGFSLFYGIKRAYYEPTRGIRLNQKGLRAYENGFDNPTKQVVVEDLKQLYVVNNRMSPNVATGTRLLFDYKYTLVGLASGSEKVIVLGKFNKFENALYIEQEIEQFLGIQDKQVAGEAFE